MNSIAAPGEAWAYATREGLIEKDGIAAIFVDSRCHPLGTSRVWSAGARVADSIEQVRDGLRLRAAGLVLVCDSAATAASAGGHLAALKRLASDYDMLVLDVIHAAHDRASARRPESDVANGSQNEEAELRRGFGSR